MAKYRRKELVVVEATQWFKNGDHPEDYTQSRPVMDGDTQQLALITGAERKEKGWEGDVVRYFRDPSVPAGLVCKDCRTTMHDHGWLDFPGGGQTVCPGDYVVKTREVRQEPGYFSPEYRAYHPRDFMALFEPVDADTKSEAP